MDKKAAWILSFLITFLLFGNYLFFSLSEQELEYHKVEKVLDGDTLDLDDGRRVRLINVNTEERGRPWSNEATDFLGKLEGKEVGIDFVGKGIYGRSLGRIYTNEYVNLELVRKGLAHKYLVEDSEESEFYNAEDKARDEGLGIWKKSEYYGCIDVEINKYDEYVDLVDSCGLNLEGLSIQDESTKRYVLPIVSGNKIRIYSEKGDDKGTELYWGAGKVWNNERDSIFIRDSSGFLVYYYAY